MGSDAAGGSGRFVHYAFAGLEAGIYGGLLMLGWFMADSLWKSESAWRVPDLLASTFYGDAAFSGGSKMVTLSGIALHLVTAGVLGAIFGLSMREARNYFRVALLGLVLGLGWYYLAYVVVWKKVNPFIPLYSSYRSVIVGHFLFGGVLGRYPHCLASLRRRLVKELPAEVGQPDC